LQGGLGWRPALHDTEFVSIFSVAVSLRSTTHSVEHLTRLAGIEPTRSYSKGDPISKRRPSPDSVRKQNYWNRRSDVQHDTWTLAPHWPTIAPVLESLAEQDLSDVQVQLSIGTHSRGFGFAFDIEQEHLGLMSRASCGIWIDSYPPVRDSSERPDDYPYSENSTIRPANSLRKFRTKINHSLRELNPIGRIRRHRGKSPADLRAEPLDK
jgi:hypothetical protein